MRGSLPSDNRSRKLDAKFIRVRVIIGKFRESCSSWIRTFPTFGGILDRRRGVIMIRQGKCKKTRSVCRINSKES